jgi:hypothetical protein
MNSTIEFPRCAWSNRRATHSSGRDHCFISGANSCRAPVSRAIPSLCEMSQLRLNLQIEVSGIAFAVGIVNDHGEAGFKPSEKLCPFPANIFSIPFLF